MSLDRSIYIVIHTLKCKFELSSVSEPYQDFGDSSTSASSSGDSIISPLSSPADT